MTSSDNYRLGVVCRMVTVVERELMISHTHTLLLKQTQLKSCSVPACSDLTHVLHVSVYNNSNDILLSVLLFQTAKPREIMVALMICYILFI